MADYDRYPAVDDNYNFPPQVLDALIETPQMKSKYAHLSGGNLVVGGVPVGGGGGGGGGNANVIFVNNLAEIPVGTLPDTIVILRT